MKIKKWDKKKRRKGMKAGGKKRAPSGFAKPTPISDQMCKFLGVEKKSLMARTEVTKRLTKYIKENDLQKPEDRRIILMDRALKSLLKAPKGQVVTYFNLQKWIKPHFLPTKN